MLVFNWKAFISFTMLFILVLSLGIWQINRGYEKKELEHTYFVKQSMPVEEIKNNNDLKTNNLYRNIVIEGSYHDQSFYVDNKTNQGKAGVKVVMPFDLLDGSSILVSRGWIPFTNRNILPEIETPSGVIKIQGILRPVSESFLLEDEEMQPKQNPLLVQSINLKQISDYTKISLMPFIIELSELSPSGFVSTWKPLNLSSMRHFGYAAQWFGLGLVLIVGYIFFLRRGNDK